MSAKTCHFANTKNAVSGVHLSDALLKIRVGPPGGGGHHKAGHDCEGYEKVPREEGEASREADIRFVSQHKDVQREVQSCCYCPGDDG